MQAPLIGISTTLFLVMPAYAGLTPPTAILREGDLLDEGVVGAIDNPAVNHLSSPQPGEGVGGYSYGVAIGGIDRFWGNPTGGDGTVLRSEMTIDNLEQVSFESFSGLADDGTVAYSASCTDVDSGTTGLDSVWFGDTLILVEEQPVPNAPGFFYSFGSRPGCGSEIPWAVIGLTDTQGGSTDERALVQGLDAQFVLRSGDLVPGLPLPLSNGGPVDFDTRFSRSGQNYIAPVQMVASTSEDTAVVVSGAGLVIDMTLVREGNPVPPSAGGLPGENWAAFDYVGITDTGDYLLTGDTSGAVATDEFVLVNDQIVVREGDSLGGEVVGGAIEAGYMNEDGDWAVIWDVAGGDLEALIVNGTVLLREGDPIDFNGNGMIDLGTSIDNFTGIVSLAMTDRDRDGVVRVYCTADIDTGDEVLEVALCVTADLGDGSCPCDFDGDGMIGVDDLLVILGNWNGPGGDCTGDGTTDVDDLLAVLAAWGDC